MPERVNPRARAGLVDPAKLLEMAAVVSRTSDTEKALRIIGEYGMNALGCDGAAVFLYHDEERSITPLFVLASGEHSPIVEDKISLRLSRDSAFWRSLHTDAVMTYKFGKKRASRREVIDLSGVSLLVLKSIASGRGPEGVLLFHWSGGKQRLSKEESRLISALSDQCAAVLVRGRLFRDLEKSEEKYRLLTENAQDIIFALDTSGRFTFLNSAVLDILGYNPEDLIGEYFSEIVTEESWESSQNAIRSAASSGKDTFSYEWVALDRNGEHVYLDVRASFVRRGSEIVGQQGIARDVTESRRMREEIERRGRELSLSLRRQSEMKGYLALVTRIQEEERKRISRELHDDTVQALVALVRQLEILESELGEVPGYAAKRIAGMVALANTTLENLRRFTRDLRPPMLDDLGLEAAVEWLCLNMGERAGLPVTLTVNGVPKRLLPEVEVALYRIAQEGINNAIKHAEPAEVRVAISYLPDAVELVVADDGKGFVPPDVVGISDSPNGLGLVGIYERAELLGGKAQIKSEIGKGTVLTVIIPLTTNQPLSAITPTTAS